MVLKIKSKQTKELTKVFVMLISSYERQTQCYVYKSPTHATLQNSHGTKSGQKGFCPSFTKWFLVFLDLVKAIQRDEISPYRMV